MSCEEAGGRDRHADAHPETPESTVPRPQEVKLCKLSCPDLQ